MEKNLLFEKKEKDLNQENTALQKQIKNKEQRINTLLTKGSSPPNKKTSLGEETKKADELKTTKEKIAKLEERLNQIIQDKDGEINNLKLKINNYDNLFKENENHKNEITKLKTQLRNQTTSLSVIHKLEQEKNKLQKELETERTERQKLEREKEQDSNAKKIETLQQKIDEDINIINSLYEDFQQAETN